MIAFVSGTAAVLDFGFGRVKDLIKEMTPDQLEATPAGFTNSLATLAVHVYGLEARLGYGFRGQPVPEAVAAELLLTLPRTQSLPVVKGETAESLTARVEKARAILKEGLETLTEADLDREVELGPGRKMPIRTLAALLPQHQAQHYGQMQMVKKALG